MDLKKTLNQLSVEADYVGLRYEENKSTYLKSKEDSLESPLFFNDSGVIVEVMSQGHMAYAATSSLNQSSIQAAADKALSLAKQGAGRACLDFQPGAHRFSSKGEFQSPVKKSFSPKGFLETEELLLQATTRLKNSHSNIATSSGMLVVEQKQVQTANTLGGETFQNLETFFVTLRLLAASEKGQQWRSNGTEVVQGGMEHLNHVFSDQKLDQQSQEVQELLEAELCPTETMDLVLAPDQLYLQVHESIGHPLELDRILGDERNYAGWSFVKKEDFGRLKYGSDLLNVTFDPTRPMELATYRFDEGGAEAKKEFVIKDGLLLRGLGGVESEARSGLKGVSSFRAQSWNRAPIDRMANLNIEPGSSSFNDLISQVERGVFMKTNKSWSIDDYRNRFQFGCEYAQLIEDGQLTKVVKNPNYRGVSVPFWNSLKAVGDESTVVDSGSFFCGKGEPNQIVKVGHTVPSCLFEKCEVFGVPS